MVSQCTLDETIKENSNLVYSICSKYRNYADIEDLYQEGIIGLIKAHKNFNPEYNVKFSTYAFTFIVGEVNKYIRENKTLKISRDLVKLGKKIREYIDKHIEVRGYEPSTLDIANMLEIPEPKVIIALESLSSVKSLDMEINNDGRALTLMDMTASTEKISNEQLLDLKEAFNYLSDDEKYLLVNRYYKDFTQSEIAKELGVNQVYVSRLEKKALTKMKDKMVVKF